MGIGTVGIVTLNNQQGGFKQPEKTFLYIGTAGAGGTASGAVTIGSGSNLDTLFGAAASNLKTQLAAAIANAKDNNFFAYAYPLAAEEDYAAAVKKLLTKPDDLNVEAIVVCDPVETNAEVVAAQTLADYITSAYAKFVAIHLCVAGIDSETQTWAQYVTAAKTVRGSTVADRVTVTLNLWADCPGTVCGRLCSPAASIADTPMRVKTGAVTLSGDLPVDSTGAPLDMTIIKDLSEAGFSVPQWYDGYDGIYWADMPVLDAETGDFQVIEHRRVIDYLCRRVRIQAIKRIGDRSLNSTDKSIAAAKTYFAAPLRAAAKPVVVAGVEVPALIQPPGDDAVNITWTSQTEVSIAITVQPFGCPKKITVYLGLDLSVEA
ncbi:MAG: DUF2586 domain-containing protein [Victivallaceae bacterium]|nr:DUF2586 domain-containing protein [Victivallaceae bacterium]